MAIAATQIWEVETGGSDTVNGGGFDPAQTAHMDATGSVSSANTASPVFTSSNYNFQGSDVGAWLYISSGTSTLPGWYYIVSVASNAATLSAGAGGGGPGTAFGVLKSTMQPSTSTGCGTTSSLSSVVWSVDYSQQSGNGVFNGVTFTTSGTSATLTPSITPTGGMVSCVGNTIVITNQGTGSFGVLGYFTIVNTTTITLTADRNVSTGSALAAVFSMGGALKSIGQAGANHIASQTIYQKAGSYGLLTATANIATGGISLTAGVTNGETRLIGYNALRGDFGTPPVNTAGSYGTFTIVAAAGDCLVDNISVSGNGQTSSKGFGGAAGSQFIRCKAASCTNSGFVGVSGVLFVACQTTLCSAAASFLNGWFYDCVAIANTTVGFSISVTGCNCTNCVSANNTGGTATGFSAGGSANLTSFNNCISYGNQSHNFQAAGGTAFAVHFRNCVSEGSTAGYGFNATAATDNIRMYNCATYNNFSGAINANISTQNQFGNITQSAGTFFVAPTASPPDFTPNSTAGQGALIRGAGWPGLFPNLINSTTYIDAGAIQHQDAGGSSGGLIPVNLLGGIRG